MYLKEVYEIAAFSLSAGAIRRLCKIRIVDSKTINQILDNSLSFKTGFDAGGAIVNGLVAISHLSLIAYAPQKHLTSQNWQNLLMTRYSSAS